MKTTHTPGPWAVIHSGKTVVGPPVATVALPISSSPGRREVIACSIENTANARLIAAAPELLDALRGLLAVKTDKPASMDDHAAHTDQCLREIAAEDNARSAIARATTL